MGKTTVEILREARGYIERGWTQGAFARDGDGHKVAFEHPAAGCFCALGAIERAEGGDTSYASGQRARFSLRAVIGSNLIGEWNDAPERTKEEVLSAFSRAIAIVEARS